MALVSKDGGKMNVLSVLILAGAVTGAGPDGEKLQLRPKFSMGQEITYSGKIVETVTGRQGVRYEQPYQLESTVLVLESDPNRISKLGCYTVVRMPGNKGTAADPKLDQAESVHLDMVTVSPRGKPTWTLNEAEVFLSPDGIAPWELGFLIEMPEEAISVGATWELKPTGQPTVHCEFAGFDVVTGVRCAKIVTTQESQNWESETIGQTAWRNQTTLWWDLKTGVTYKVERNYSVRESSDPDASRRYVTTYTQDNNLRYRGPIMQERVQDFQAAFDAQTKFEKAIASTGPQSTVEFGRIKSQLKVASDKLYSTPYRPVMAYLLEQVSAAEQNPDAVSPVTIVGRNASRIGRPARNFIIRDMESSQQISLSKMKDAPAVIVVVNPTSLLSLQALSVAVKAVEGSDAKLYAVCTKTEADTAKHLRKMVPGEYTLCMGGGFDKSYGVTTTPHTIFIDGKGILRASFAGLGPEMYVALGRELGLHAAPKQVGHKTDGGSVR